MKKIIILTFFCLITATAFAQNRPGKGTKGLAASIQGNQTNILLPIWTSQETVIAPVVGIRYEADIATNLNLGVQSRFYRTLGRDFAHYLGVQGLIQHRSPDVGDDQTDLIIGGTGGGEYFLNPRFSLGVEAQLNLFLRDGNNNILATGAAITGTYYFDY